MRKGKLPRDQKQTTGTAIVEFAMMFPVLMLMMLGAVDFARIHYHAITVASAAGTGSFYGSLSNIKSGKFSTMAQKAEHDSANLSSVTANSSRYCECPDGTEVSCTEGNCAGYGAPRVYVRTRVQDSFETLVAWPGIPSPVIVSRTAFMRAQ